MTVESALAKLDAANSDEGISYNVLPGRSDRPGRVTVFRQDPTKLHTTHNVSAQQG